MPSVVTSNADLGPGSLRDAITAAQPGEVISFAASLANQTITLKSSLPALATNLTITAAGVPNVTVSGAGAFQVFDVSPNVQATIDSLRITDGLNTLSVLGTGGGGITVNPGATLTLTNCNVTRNEASANFLSTVGGGILNEGTLSATNCFITNNGANLNLSGGSAGGIANDGMLTLMNCVVSGNQALASAGNLIAGGITNSANGTVTLFGCNVTNNAAVSSVALSSAAGGVASNGTISVTGCYFAGNTVLGSAAGPIPVFSSEAGGLSGNGNATISNSTFASNEASGNTSAGAIAGGIGVGGVLVLTNSTVASNALFTASAVRAAGGGVAVNGTAVLTNCTVANNTASDSNSLAALGGGIGIFGPLTLANTIVAGNSFFGSASEGTPGPDVSSGNRSLGITANNSLIGSPQGDGYNITSGSGNLTNTNPQFDPAGLRNNGGSVPTLALQAMSLAIDAGNNGFVINSVFGVPPFTDERGTGFNRIINNVVDMGAYEFQPSATTTTLTSAVNPSNAGGPVLFTAQVAGSAPGSNLGQGHVIFIIDGVALAAVTLVNGTATFLATGLSIGSHTVQANYDGFVEGAYQLLASSASLTQVVNATPASASTVKVVSSLDPAQIGQAVTFTAQVSSAGSSSATPTGSVSFFDGSTLLGMVNLSGGQATLTTAGLRVGVHSIFAVYSGDGHFLPSTGDVKQVVDSPAFPTDYFAIGTDAGVPTLVSLYDDHGKLFGAFNPFAGTGFTGGVRVALGDVTGDGIPDLIVGSGPGGVTVVLVYEGTSLVANPNNPTVFRSFNPYGTAFNGGVFVAVGNLDGSQLGAIITGADSGGGPQVNIYSAAQVQAGNFGAAAVSFFAYPFSNGVFFTGGVRVAAADLDGDGIADLITGAGPGGGPQVNVYRGTSKGFIVGAGTAFPLPFLAFYAFGPSLSGFRGGVYVTAQEVTGDNRADLFFGAGPGGGPEVAGFSGSQLTASTPNLNPAIAFFGITPTSFAGGVRVGSGLGVVGSRIVPILLAAAGPGGGPQVGEFDAAALFANPAMTNPFAMFNDSPGGFMSGLFAPAT